VVKRNRSRWYVGVLKAGVNREAFARYEYNEPTAELYPAYSYVIGPFRTEKAAVLCVMFPSAASTVAGYERMSKLYQAQMIGKEIML